MIGWPIRTFFGKYQSGYDYITEDYVETDYFIFEGYPEVILEPVDQPLLFKAGCHIYAHTDLVYFSTVEIQPCLFRTFLTRINQCCRKISDISGALFTLRMR